MPDPGDQGTHGTESRAEGTCPSDSGELQTGPQGDHLAQAMDNLMDANPVCRLTKTYRRSYRRPSRAPSSIYHMFQSRVDGQPPMPSWIAILKRLVPKVNFVVRPERRKDSPWVRTEEQGYPETGLPRVSSVEPM